MTFTPTHLPLWLGQPAPRYTSYPPATQFRQTTPAEGTVALRELTNVESVSLYLHIPFCRSLCLFCGCHQAITNRSERIAAYLDVLRQEMVSSARLWPHKLKIAHLHLGGGSPSILVPGQLHALMHTIREHYELLPGAEQAIELDPRTTTPELIAALAQEGFNRASLGVQDFAPEVQMLVNRIQPFEMVERVMQQLRAAGITALSLDLMYGLPGQTAASVHETARMAVRLAPQRFSLFSYAHVPQMKPYQKKLEQAGLPTEQEKLNQEAAMREVLLHAGYRAIGIDHFALPDDKLARAARAGRLSRNFQGYTDDPAQAMLGFGASSISDTGHAYVQNEPDLEAYQQRVMRGEVPAKRICIRSAEDNRRAALIRDLMCHCRLDLAAHGYSLAPFMPALQPYIEKGLVNVEGDVLRVDTTYRMAVRAVCTVFDQYYNPAALSSRVA